MYQPESDGHAAVRYIAENLRRRRERLDKSQKAVAEEMVARGWPWHGTTVQRIENGVQQPGAGELTDLAQILGTSVTALARPGPEDTALALVDRAHGQLHRSWHEAADACERLLRDRDWAERTLKGSAESPYESVRSAAGDLAAELGERTLEAAAGEALYRCENAGGQSADDSGDGA